MEYKNNVTRLLDSRKIHYTIHRYDYDAGVHSAVAVAEAIGLSPEQVFKTLVVMPDDKQRKPMIVVIPGPGVLDLKLLAKASRLKKAKMATHEQAEKLTGLQTGGISPLALPNKGFDIYLDQRATEYEKIAISAGERGTNVELLVKDLLKLTNARVITLA